MKFSNIHDEVAYKNCNAYRISANVALSRLRDLKREGSIDAKEYSRNYMMLHNNLHSWFRYLGLMQNRVPLVTSHDWPETKKLMFKTNHKFLNVWQKLLMPYYLRTNNVEAIVSVERTLHTFYHSTARDGKNTPFTISFENWYATQKPALRYWYNRTTKKFEHTFHDVYCEGLTELNKGNKTLFRPSLFVFDHDYQVIDSVFSPQKNCGQITGAKEPCGLFVYPIGGDKETVVKDFEKYLKVFYNYEHDDNDPF